METATINEEVETLGIIAAHCDVMSVDPTLPFSERNELILRAEHYRNLQIAALSEMIP